MTKKEKKDLVEGVKVVFIKNFEGQFNQFKFKVKTGDVKEVDEAVINYLLDQKAIKTL